MSTTDKLWDALYWTKLRFNLFIFLIFARSKVTNGDITKLFPNYFAHKQRPFLSKGNVVLIDLKSKSTECKSNHCELYSAIYNNGHMLSLYFYGYQTMISPHCANITERRKIIISQINSYKSVAFHNKALHVQNYNLTVFKLTTLAKLYVIWYWMGKLNQDISFYSLKELCSWQYCFGYCRAYNGNKKNKDNR